LPAELGIIWALILGVPAYLLGEVRRRKPAHRPSHGTGKARSAGPASAAVAGRVKGAAAFVLPLFVVNTLAFYYGRPMMTFGGLVPLILVNLAIVVVLVVARDARRHEVSATGPAMFAIAVAFGIVWFVGHNSGHDAYHASHLVSVTVEPGDRLPASSTANMVIVSPDIATTKASQAMATGLAGQRNYSTYLELGPATLQFVDGHMWYVFPLEFDGAGNKARLHAVVPGYIMVSAGVLVINAHTGQISRYRLGGAPDWVDRVYSQGVAEDIANWYGMYSQAGFQGLGSSNANRFQVSGTPVMVYTGTAHPAWRMLLTSHNSDNSVSKIIEMNAATGAMQIYSPQRPMGIENPVYQAFDNGSGVGASLVKANHYQAVNLTLHVIYGHLTWMATYEPESSNPSFVGVGFVDAYEATANNVVFGSSRSAALQNYLTQLSGETTANGSSPSQAGSIQTVTGTIAQAGWDITGGQKYWYITLAGDRDHVYVGTVAAVGPALVLAQPGDSVTITVLDVGIQESTRTMQSFRDTRVQLRPAGS
jgi:hypothetical protein